MDSQTEQEILSQLAECEEVGLPYQEGFADTVKLFSEYGFGVWLTGDDPGPFEDCFEGAIDYQQFDDTIDAVDDIVRGFDDPNCVTHPYAKLYIRKTATERFSAAYEKLCARFGVCPDGSPEEQAQTLVRMRREGKTGWVGATMLFWRLYDQLPGDGYDSKRDAFDKMGVRL